MTRAQVAAHIAEFVAITNDVPEDNWVEENFLRALPEKWKLSMAAWTGGAPIGYAILSAKATDQAHLHHFMIHHRFRGQQLGNRLRLAYEQRAAKSGYARLTLKTPISFHDARKFYARYGYAEVATDGDYVLLEKPLSHQAR